MAATKISVAFDPTELPLDALSQYCTATEPPTRQTLSHLRDECMQQAAAIPCLWFGTLGIVGYFSTLAQWRNILQDPNAVFMPIPEPDRQMPPLPPGVTAAQREHLTREYKEP